MHWRTFDETGWELVLKTVPTAQPITLVQAKAQLTIEHTDDDTLIALFIEAATIRVEQELGRQLVRATYNLHLDLFPGGREPIWFPINPVSAITSINYEDENGATQSWTAGDAGFQSTIAGETRARVAPAPNESYPATESERLRAVNILFNAGYSDSDGNVASIPENYKHAIKMYVRHIDENREIVATGTIVTPIPDTIKSLLGPTTLVGIQ